MFCKLFSIRYTYYVSFSVRPRNRGVYWIILCCYSTIVGAKKNFILTKVDALFGISSVGNVLKLLFTRYTYYVNSCVRPCNKNTNEWNLIFEELDVKTLRRFVIKVQVQFASSIFHSYECHFANEI